MKKITPLAVIAILAFTSCSQDDTDVRLPETEEINFRVAASYEDNSIVDAQRNSENTTHCYETALIAGQYHVAGSVIVDRDGDDLVITYTTNRDWTIGATHMSIGGCDDQSIPTNKKGNPKIGKFEYHTTHTQGVNKVVYTVNALALPNTFCFAAHAEVSGPNGNETAWADGIEFGGGSWATFVQMNLSDCEGTTEETNEEDETDEETNEDQNEDPDNDDPTDTTPPDEF